MQTPTSPGITSQTGPSVSLLTLVQADDKLTKLCFRWVCFQGKYTEKPPS